MRFKKYDIYNVNDNLFGGDFKVYNFEETENKNIYYLKSKVINCSCPHCGMVSNSLHATCTRTIQFVPIHLKPTYINVNFYKFNCLNEECPVKVFRQDIKYCGPKQKFTYELKCLIFAVSLFLSDETTSKVLKLIGINVSNDTVRRLYQNIGIKDELDVEEIGLDDVSIRKGMKYATVIYDMKDHHMLALLDGRDGKTLKEWLQNHKKIKKIARDRATAYANAINEVLPETIQIADRFHLFQNLVDRFKEIFKQEIPENIYILDGKILDEKPNNIIVKATVEQQILQQLEYDDTPPVDENVYIIKFNNKSSEPNDKHHLIQAENRKKK